MKIPHRNVLKDLLSVIPETEKDLRADLILLQAMLTNTPEEKILDKVGALMGKAGDINTPECPVWLQLAHVLFVAPNRALSLALVTLERDRQQKEEGFDDAHDDKYTNDELTRAAICYLDIAQVNGEAKESLARELVGFDGEGGKWPWDSWFKPTYPIRDLVKAGALILAEIDRRLRAGEQYLPDAKKD